MATNPFLATWRIVWIAVWDQDYVDMEAPGYITFGKKGLGNFQFGLVQAQMDYRINGNRAEFTWSGFDEDYEISGRGFAEIVQNELHGHIYIHLGDDSAFRPSSKARDQHERASIRRIRCHRPHHLQ